MLDGTFDATLPGRLLLGRCGQGRQDGAGMDIAPQHLFRALLRAALFRRELFERVGFLDEDFESYLEDVEFGLRCALAGCQGTVCPGCCSPTIAAVLHWDTGTPTRSGRMARNQLLLGCQALPRQLAMAARMACPGGADIVGNSGPETRRWLAISERQNRRFAFVSPVARLGRESARNLLYPR